MIGSARRRRTDSLPAHLTKCPVEALATYVDNNWDRFNASAFKGAGLPFVSARAEAQVRDRTKARFSGPATWRTENLEGKATLRAIIADGRWPAFQAHFLRQTQRGFREGIDPRIRRAIAEKRLAPDILQKLGLEAPTHNATQPKLAS